LNDIYVHLHSQQLFNIGSVCAYVSLSHDYTKYCKNTKDTKN